MLPTPKHLQQPYKAMFWTQLIGYAAIKLAGRLLRSAGMRFGRE